jgi:hypothetical protein
MGWKGRLVVAVGVLLVIVGGLIVATLLISPAPGLAVAASPTSTPPPASFSKLDGPSRELAEDLGPGEKVTAALLVRDDEAVATLASDAREAGLTVEPAGGERSQVTVTGPHEDVLALTSLPIVGSARLTEDLSALRVLAAPLEPGRPFPVSGRPYVEGLPIDPMSIPIPADRLAGMLGTLAEQVVTIDGQPYPDLLVDGNCNGEPVISECYIDFEGATVRGGDRRDRWPIHSSVRTGWFPAVDPANPPTLRAVPRWLAREAERIARTDEATLEQIRHYTWVADFGWIPADAKLIEVRYLRTCPGGLGQIQVASLAGGPVADHGVCVESVTVTVDVVTKRVVPLR